MHPLIRHNFNIYIAHEMLQEKVSCQWCGFLGSCHCNIGNHNNSRSLSPRTHFIKAVDFMEHIDLCNERVGIVTTAP
jgi:hypothetical protein